MPSTDEQWAHVTKANDPSHDWVKIGEHYFTRDELDALIDADIPGFSLTIDAPPPRYYVLADRNRTAVCERPAGRLVASFHHYVHPNPKAAAEAEAARLNREVG